MFDFSEALRKIKNGERVRREGWNGRGMWLALRVAGDGLDEFIYIRNAQSERVPWQPSQTDMLANDWTMLAPGAP